MQEDLVAGYPGNLVATPPHEADMAAVFRLLEVDDKRLPHTAHPDGYLSRPSDATEMPTYYTINPKTPYTALSVIDNDGQQHR